MNSSKIKNDLIASINLNDINPRTIFVGTNLTAVESKNLGIASTVKDKNYPHKIVEETGRLEELPIDRLLNFLNSDILLKASIGMATLNSLIDLPRKVDRGNAFEIIKTKANNKNLGIVGHFHFVDRFCSHVKNCWVFEKEPKEDDLPEHKMNEYLPQCDILVITGQTLINGTLSEILNYSPNAYKILLGPSSPMSPVLFDYGIDVIGGVRMTHNNLVKKFIQQGTNFRQLEGIELVMMKK